jgi:sulfate permease, SulP family
VSRPTVSVLGRAPDAPVYADLETNPGFAPLPNVLILRPNAPLLFANARYVRTAVLDLVDRAEGASSIAVLDLEMSYRLDVDSADTLAELREALGASGIDLWLAGVHAHVCDVLERCGYLDSPDVWPIFAAVEPAIQKLRGDAGRGAE